MKKVTLFLCALLLCISCSHKPIVGSRGEPIAYPNPQLSDCRAVLLSHNITLFADYEDATAVSFIRKVTLQKDVRVMDVYDNLWVIKTGIKFIDGKAQAQSWVFVKRPCSVDPSVECDLRLRFVDTLNTTKLLVDIGDDIDFGAVKLKVIDCVEDDCTVDVLGERVSTVSRTALGEKIIDDFLHIRPNKW